ncbi:MAG TPA: TMEM165/GDT1 family protein [Candidatus Saccharimonadales bacterium]|nr:TMEM165/GDT1 family protein [Candidatus Saccharimonadales bacterium]
MDFSIVALVFGVIFISELPDKSMFASLILGIKYRKMYVWLGASAAFLVHVVIAVTAGQALTLLPHRLVEAIVAALFFAGAAMIFFGKHSLEAEPEPGKVARAEDESTTFWKVFGTSFGIVFIGEWGDITQIATANYTAQFHDPLSVAIGATLALWAVTGLAILVGAKLIKYVPAKLLQRITGTVLLIFGCVSTYHAFQG